MQRVILILLSLSFVTSSALAQEALVQTTLDLKDYDTSFIKDYHKKLTLRIYTVNKSNNFTVTDIGDDLTTEFKPNDATNLGFGINYKALGLSIAFIPLGSKNRSKYGRTRKLDLMGNLYTRRFGFDLRLQFYRGFYIENPNSIAPSVGTTQNLVIKRPDISTFSWAGSAFYIFNNEKFSFKSSFTHNERQKKSAGSFFSGYELSSFLIRADTIVAPTTIIDTLDPRENFESINIYALGGFGGYAHTFVIGKPLFITMALAPGFAFVNINARDGHDTRIDNPSRLAFLFKARLSMGYNSDKYFGGISTSSDFSSFSFQKNQGSVSYTTGALRIYFGMRFF